MIHGGRTPGGKTLSDVWALDLEAAALGRPNSWTCLWDLGKKRDESAAAEAEAVADGEIDGEAGGEGANEGANGKGAKPPKIPRPEARKGHTAVATPAGELVRVGFWGIGFGVVFVVVLSI